MRLHVWLIAIFLLGLPALLISSARGVNDPSVLEGCVTDEHGPVAQVRVRCQGCAAATSTDRDGKFQLQADARPAGRVTGWKQGYLIAGAAANLTPLLLRLERLPENDNQQYEWVDPRPDPARRLNCANCHRQIYDEWSAEGHARSTSNRRFLNLYDGSDWSGHAKHGWNLLADRPDGAGVCNACHAPTESFTADLRQLTGVATQGIHCDYCHKVTAANTAHVGLTHGRYALSLLRPEKGQLFFGPLDDVDRHEDSYVPLYQQSRFCAGCHEGTVFGVRVYETYTEWLSSPARHEGKQCQSCHMAPSGMTNIAPGNGGIERDPATLASHRFFQGSQLDMLRQALHVDVAVTRDGDATRAAISVRAEGIGHRLPTGFIDRNLVLIVRGFDVVARELNPIAGPRLPKIAGPGVAGKLGRLYAKVLSNPHGDTPLPFWRAEAVPADSRLVPNHPDRLVGRFPLAVTRLRVQVFYRRFWPDVARDKQWPDNELEVLDASYRRKP